MEKKYCANNQSTFGPFISTALNPKQLTAIKGGNGDDPNDDGGIVTDDILII